MDGRVTPMLLLGAALLAGVACDQRGGSPDPAAAIPEPFLEARDPVRVTPDAARRLIGAPPGVLVVDVRTAEEYAAARLPGARRIELDRLAAALDAGELPGTPATPVLVYCRSGGRSAQAAALLVARGHARVYDLEGGITAWSEAGLPVAR